LKEIDAIVKDSTAQGVKLKQAEERRSGSSLPNSPPNCASRRKELGRALIISILQE